MFETFLSLSNFRDFAVGIAQAAIIVLPVSLARFAYERAVIPLYGSVPTQFLLNKIILATILIAAVTARRPSTRDLLLSSGGLYAAPLTTHWVAVLTSRWRDPIWGPAITHVIVFAPIAYGLTTFAMNLDVSEALSNCSIQLIRRSS